MLSVHFIVPNLLNILRYLFCILLKKIFLVLYAIGWNEKKVNHRNTIYC